MNRVGLTLIGFFLLAAPAFAQTAPAKIADTSKGKVFVDAKGMTLYVFAKDDAGNSVCYGKCETRWPPFAAAADAKAFGDWSIVTRKDGAKQWAYKGKPLYTWEKDKAPGDVTGDGVNNTWKVAVP
jgi:predicted lipoprotein with Yx(FWY)xxD motif